MSEMPGDAWLLAAGRGERARVTRGAGFEESPGASRAAPPPAASRNAVHGRRPRARRGTQKTMGDPC